MDEARRSDEATRMAASARSAGDSPAGPASRNQTSDDRTLTEMISGVVTNLQNIVRSEVQLAKTEMTEEARTAGKGAAMLASAALVAFYAVGLFLLAAVWALATQVDRWLAALIVGVVVAAVAGVLAMLGKKRFEEFSLKPEQTIDSVKEDIEWVKQQTP